MTAHDPASFYRLMLTIRRFEERVLRLRLEGRVFGTVHPSIGQEAIAVGVISRMLPADRLVSTHRGHGHLIARGVDLTRLMAELLGRVDGCCGGQGGSMHVTDCSKGVLGANGVVAAGLPIAAGSALASILTGDHSVTVCFFGDGATGQGAFHESLNLSALESLPVVWVCENNQYAAFTPVARTVPTGSIASYAGGYGIPAEVVDGTDVTAVAGEAARAIGRARDGGGPTLLECRAFRFGVHAQRGVPLEEKRSPDELNYWKSRDPVNLLAARITTECVEAEQALLDIERDVDESIERAVTEATASSFPDANELRPRVET